MERTHIHFLSSPQSVHMADEWFGVASGEHFWFRRRFEVFKKFAGDSLKNAASLCEVGCGSGVLQSQIEEWLGRGVDGFDLNQASLAQNRSRLSRLFYYNIHDRHEDFRARYDGIILFDVLEHIDDDIGLLDVLRFYLTDDGTIYVNTPALPSAYSKYDEKVGHVRRYSLEGLRRTAEEAGLVLSNWTFWGFPLLPLLYARKWLLKFRPPKDTIHFGMSQRNSFWNGLLNFLCSLEKVPQRFIGPSLMATLTQK